MTKKKAQLIVALDVYSLEKVRQLVDQLVDYVDYYKVGSQLFTACGPTAVRFIEARGKKVFLDLKYHDIPHTVARSVEAAVGLSIAVKRNIPDSQRENNNESGLAMFTIHTAGGLEMMKEAVSSSRKMAENIKVARPLVIGVTVLTSEQKRDNILDLVLQRAALAKEAGIDGVVASCHEAQAIRKEFGQDFVIITPGIRPLGSDKGDQQRVATPQKAVESGSNFLVVGRPILQASDPQKAAIAILEEM